MTGAHAGQCLVRSNASLVLARWDRPSSFEQNNGQTRLKILRSHNLFGGRLLTKDAQSETKKASLVLARWDRPSSFEQNNGQTRLKILRSHNFFGGRLLTKDAQSETKKARGNSCCDVASKTVTNDFLCITTTDNIL